MACACSYNQDSASPSQTQLRLAVDAVAAKAGVRMPAMLPAYDTAKPSQVELAAEGAAAAQAKAGAPQLAPKPDAPLVQVEPAAKPPQPQRQGVVVLHVEPAQRPWFEREETLITVGIVALAAITISTVWRNVALVELAEGGR